MTDLEMTKLCAEAMGIKLVQSESCELATICGLPYFFDGMRTQSYDPLHDDTQAMQLVKKCRLSVGCLRGSGTWNVVGTYPAEAENSDLNRAIVETIAKMQAARNDSVTQKE
jgi:hypothetical protein